MDSSISHDPFAPEGLTKKEYAAWGKPVAEEPEEEPKPKAASKTHTTTHAARSRAKKEDE